MNAARIAAGALICAVLIAARPVAPLSASAGGTVAIGFIGDSITEGAPAGGALPPAELAVSMLQSGNLTARAINEGRRGSTSADWIPRADSAYLPRAMAAFARARVRVVHIMLGTNDANPDGASISARGYKANLAAVCKTLHAAGYTVVLSYPPFAQPNAGSATRLAMDARLRAYEPMIDALVNGKTILRGDTHAYSFFQQHPWELADGIHPTAGGVQALARLWAAALRPVVTRR